MYIQFKPITQEIPKLLTAQGGKDMGGSKGLQFCLINCYIKKKTNSTIIL